MESIVIILVLFWLLWWVSLQIFPGPMRLLQRVSRSLIRRLTSLTWSGPVRRFGLGRTLWLWSVVLAVVVTIQTATAPLAVMPVGHRLLVVVQVWLLVAAGWWLLSWWAQRRFRARPLPQRRPRRR